jgi:cytochrome c oxidase assembly protein subunit 15
MTGRGVNRFDGFQKLAVATTVTTYLLILVGALVRATGSGMGCPDWPKCFGNWVPPLTAADLPAGFDAAQFNAAKTWTEYFNRLLGATTGLLIFATLIAAIRRYRHRADVLWPAVLAFLAVGFEGWLGGRVVAHGLAPWIVTAHLMGALVVVGALLYATVHAFLPPLALPSSPRDTGMRRLMVLSAAVFGLAIAQLALGTQVRSHLDHSEAAGRDPVAVLASPAGLDLMHRRMSIVVAALTLVLWSRIRRATAASRAVRLTADAAVALVIAQVAAGIAVAYLAIPPAAQVAHVVLASLYVGALMTLLILIPRTTTTGDA